VILGHGHADQLPAASTAVLLWASDLVSLAVSTGGRREQLGQGLGHLPGRDVLELDRAGRADPMTGKTPAIPGGAGLPRLGPAVELVPDAGFEFAVECLELLPDFGLGPAPDLLPDPAAGR
jgi:hypothetical protein